MQHAAHAYFQTQVGTTGQGEIVVMLYDGALCFLAQAREKIQLKDYAAKGMLISRTLDIVNELDSSLNMEAGGELARNLHQLYFMCTTRLLQASLKMDLVQLDSVVDILSGLRSAFQQVVSTPEAQAAAASIARKGSHTNTTPRALSTPPQGPTTTARTVAVNVYAQHQGQHPASPIREVTAQPALLAPSVKQGFGQAPVGQNKAQGFAQGLGQNSGQSLAAFQKTQPPAQNLTAGPALLKSAPLAAAPKLAMPTVQGAQAAQIAQAVHAAQTNAAPASASASPLNSALNSTLNSNGATVTSLLGEASPSLNIAPSLSSDPASLTLQENKPSGFSGKRLAAYGKQISS